jgi:small subunit ribosomal protein S6
MFIVNPNASEEEIDKINGQLESIITSGGGKIEKIEKMGKRRLAYEIDKHREGHYVLFVIAANGDIVKECERRLRVMDAVIKYITVRTDEEVRRFEKIRNYRQKRAARRGSTAHAAPAQPAEEGMQ